MLEACPLAGTIPVSDNVGRVGGCPPALEGVDKTGIEYWISGAEDLGRLGIDITWEVIGVVIWLGLWVFIGQSIIGSMGLVESASEWYPTRTDVESDGVKPNSSSICLSISCAQRMVARYCLCSSSSLEEFKRVPNEVMAYPIEVYQNGALGP